MDGLGSETSIAAHSSKAEKSLILKLKTRDITSEIQCLPLLGFNSELVISCDHSHIIDQSVSTEREDLLVLWHY